MRKKTLLTIISTCLILVLVSCSSGQIYTYNESKWVSEDNSVWFEISDKYLKMYPVDCYGEVTVNNETYNVLLLFSTNNSGKVEVVPVSAIVKVEDTTDETNEYIDTAQTLLVGYGQMKDNEYILTITTSTIDIEEGTIITFTKEGNISNMS